MARRIMARWFDPGASGPTGLTEFFAKPRSSPVPIRAGFWSAAPPGLPAGAMTSRRALGSRVDVIGAVT